LPALKPRRSQSDNAAANHRHTVAARRRIDNSARNHTLAFRGFRTPKEAKRQFADWANYFREKLFMMVHVYFDESAKDPKKLVVIGGFMALKKDWEAFTLKWQDVLNKYHVKNGFHFREFNTKANKDYQWSSEKRRNYFYELGMLLCERTIIPIATSYPVENHIKSSMPGHPIENVYGAFFRDVFTTAGKHWPDYRGKILFTYDHGAGIEWTEPLHKMHQMFKKDERCGVLAFDDDKDCCPLQAADFFCNIFRQAEETAISSHQAVRQPRIIDLIICRNLLPKQHPWSYQHISNFKLTVADMIEDEKRQKRAWKRRGITGKTYYPFLHHPVVSVATKNADVTHLI
jgi:hypothetical protein